LIRTRKSFITTKFAVCCVILFLGFGQYLSAQSDTGRIRIAFLGLESRNEFDQTQIVTDVLRTEIIKTETFEIVEREQLDAIYKEQELALSGFVDRLSDDDVIQLGRFASVKLLLLGSIGTLDNKTAITLRLVDAETAKIVFADSVVNRPEENIEDKLRVLAKMISDRGLQTITEPSPEKIEQARAAGNPGEALIYARKLMEISPSPETAVLIDGLRTEAAQQYDKQAHKALRSKAWDNAVVLADQAILLDPLPEFYDFRFRALAARAQALQDDALTREKLQRKEQQRRELEAAGIYTVGDQVRNYYQGIEPGGWHLGYISGVELDTDNSIDDATAWSGGEFSYVGVRKSGPPWVFYAWSAGFTVESKPSGYGDDDLIFSGRFSPFTTLYFGGGNFFFSPSFDVGAFAQTGSTNGNAGGLSAALQAMVELKFWKTIGIYGTMRIEYDWVINKSELSGLHPSWSAGIVL
jgi:TolB-like protein